jgi:3',5'-cyclic AMP phosphodiesterase CpdA
MLVAHVSDLHIGKDAATDRTAERLATALGEARVSAALVTGDVTHRGRRSELARFEEIFRAFLSSGRAVVVPGNHDRLGDDAACAMMAGSRVDVQSVPGLHVVRLDSTAPHNRSLLEAHGLLTEEDVALVEAALDRAPAGVPAALLLHHHPLPLPADDLGERLSSLLGLPNAEELPLGRRLLERIRGRCDLVLHGHRHRPSETVLGQGRARPLRILNAGSSTELAQVRIAVFHQGALHGRFWLDAGAGAPIQATALADAA